MAATNPKPDPSLMRNLGEFFGHIAKAIREPSEAPESTRANEPQHPAGETPDAPRLEVRRDIQEARRGDYLLRRTTVDEVIFDPTADDTTRPAATHHDTNGADSTEPRA